MTIYLHAPSFLPFFLTSFHLIILPLFILSFLLSTCFRFNFLLYFMHSFCRLSDPLLLSSLHLFLYFLPPFNPPFLPSFLPSFLTLIFFSPSRLSSLLYLPSSTNQSNVSLAFIYEVEILSCLNIVDAKNLALNGREHETRRAILSICFAHLPMEMIFRPNCNSRR